MTTEESTTPASSVPMWHDSEDRDRGAPPDYYMTDEELQQEWEAGA